MVVFVELCAVYALKVLRSQGMSADSLAVIFKSDVLAKILYASPAWWGFANSSDKDRLEAFLRRYSTPTLSAMRSNSEPACGGHGRQTIYKCY